MVGVVAWGSRLADIEARKFINTILPLPISDFPHFVLAMYHMQA